MPVERQQAWYVKASFGAEWGPMSVETLLEMAGNGALARDDLARCGVESNWQPVPKILDQLRSPPTSDTKSNVADEQSESEPSEDDGSLTLATVEDPAIETPVPLLRPSAPKKSRA